MLIGTLEEKLRIDEDGGYTDDVHDNSLNNELNPLMETPRITDEKIRVAQRLIDRSAEGKVEDISVRAHLLDTPSPDPDTAELLEKRRRYMQ